jgi:glycosyltransferase involved in cell wall biosynthesis
MKISYAITVCNEHNELNRLLSLLINAIRKEDEIIVQCDKDNTTSEVHIVLSNYDDIIKVIEFPLNKDFATFKNNLKDNCTGDYIFQIDADEYLHPIFIEHLPDILESNSEVDLYWVPRINTVEGLTEDHIKKWGWRVDNEKRVNFPDYQSRILKNISYIKWENKVHEVVKGYKIETLLPTDNMFCLLHPKTISKQERQNEFYNKL